MPLNNEQRENDAPARRQFLKKQPTIEERLRAIMDSTPDSIITIDVRGVILEVNRVTSQMFGYTADELIGANISMLMPEPHASKHDGYLQRYQESGESKIIGIEREVNARRKDGTVFPVEVYVSQVDHCGWYTGTVRDVTERNRGQEELRHLHQLYQSIVETSQNIVLILNPKGQIQYINPYFESLSGWQLSEVENRDWFETFLPDDDRQQIQEIFAQAISGERVLGNVNRIVTKSGEFREIEWYDAPITSGAGMIVGLLCTGHDVTEQRLLQREILQIASLEQRRIGQDLHDMIGQELTGLAIIADTVSQFGITANEKEIAAKLATGIQETLGRVRLLSRGLNPVDVNAGGLASALASISERLRTLHGYSSNNECSELLPLSDDQIANHLYRIAEEATTNALKHAKADRIDFELLLDEDWAILRVFDNGVGISVEEEEFVGLGLRIMKYRADLIGGNLTIKPREDSGTVVECRVRIASNPNPTQSQLAR